MVNKKLYWSKTFNHSAAGNGYFQEMYYNKWNGAENSIFENALF